VEDPGRRNDWHDEECAAATKEKERLWQIYLCRSTRENRAKYNRARNACTTILRRKQRQEEDRIQHEIELLANANDTCRLYEKVNLSRRERDPQIDMCRDANGMLLTNDNEVIERWKQYFDRHLNGEEAIREGTVGYLGPVAPDSQLPAPDLHKIKREIRRLKNNKACGRDGLPVELFKHGGEPLAKALHWVIERIWEEETLPAEWMEGVICPIYKKGDKLECQNYRGITLINAAYKLLSQILFQRLSPLTRKFVRQYQAGFIEARSTSDQIFSLRQILQKCREFNVPTHHIFIDFTATYDTVIREELLRIMHEFGFPDKLTRLIKVTMNSVMCFVRVAGTLSNPFETRRGLRQGDGLSCLLFNIALEAVIRRAGIDTSGTIYTKSV
jgi:hypothetical protein